MRENVICGKVSRRTHLPQLLWGIAVTRLPYGTTWAQPQIPDPSTPHPFLYPVPPLPPPPMSHTPTTIHLQTQSLNRHFKDGGQDPYFHKCVCESVTKWPRRITPNWAHTKSGQLINVPESPHPPPTKRQERERTTLKGRERKGERTREVGGVEGRLSQQIVKVNVVRDGFCLRRVFYFFFIFCVCGSLPQSVNAQRAPPGGLGETGSRQRALIPGPRSSPGVFSCALPEAKTQSINV